MYYAPYERVSYPTHDFPLLLWYQGGILLLVGFYFVGYNRLPYLHLTHSKRAIAIGATQFLTMGFGPGIVGLSFDHRTPIFFWKFVCAAIVGLFVVGGVFAFVQTSANEILRAIVFLGE